MLTSPEPKNHRFGSARHALKKGSGSCMDATAYEVNMSGQKGEDVTSQAVEATTTEPKEAAMRDNRE